MNVKSKQCLLYVAGYDPGPLDGIDGPKTKAAMKKVFDDYGVGEDGLIGILAGIVPKRKNNTKSLFWRTIHYFSRDEFRCRCGKCNGFPSEPNEILVSVVERIRETVGKPIIISSGVRCPSHNKYVGGVPNSLHLVGNAVDFCCIGMTSGQLLPIIMEQTEIKYCYAIDSNYVHMDIGR